MVERGGKGAARNDRRGRGEPRPQPLSSSECHRLPRHIKAPIGANIILEKSSNSLCFNFNNRQISKEVEGWGGGAEGAQFRLTTGLLTPSGRIGLKSNGKEIKFLLPRK